MGQALGCGKPAPKEGYEPKAGPAGSLHAGDVDNAPLKLDGKELGKKIGYFSNHGWEKKASLFGAGKSQVRRWCPHPPSARELRAPLDASAMGP